MKQIFLLLSLFFAVSVNAQKKIIVTGGGGGGTPIDTTGQFVTAVEGVNDTTAVAWKGGVPELITLKGRNFNAGNGITISGDSISAGGNFKDNILFSSNINGKYFNVNHSQLGKSSTLRVGGGLAQLYSGNVGFTLSDIGYISISPNSYESYRLPPTAPQEDNMFLISDPDNPGSLTWLPIDSLNEWFGGGGSASNWPTINDTLASDTSRLTVTGTGRAEIGGAFVNMSIAGDEIKFTSTLVENKITTTDQSFRTGSATENGRLYITSNYAQLSARNSGGVTSNFTAFRNYAQIAAADSLKITGIQEKAIDTLDYQLVIDNNNRVHKVKRQVLIADSTVTITDSTITVNRAKLLGYREYVALLYYAYSPTDTIIAEVIYNDFGFDIDWFYDGVGDYSASYVGGTVDVNKTSISFSSNATGYSSANGSSYHTLASVAIGGFNVYTRVLQLTPSPQFVAVNHILQKYGDDGSTFITIRVYE